MNVLSSVAALRRALDTERRAGRRVGFVPTMGALHEGHLSLIRRARENDVVCVSIFVNPAQFGPHEDLEAYPRPLEQDLAACEQEHVDVVFVPSVEEIYPEPPRTRIVVTAVSEPMEGRHRPGHFEGVALVVAKLFGIVGPCRAYFGQKDAQQAVVVKRMVRDLDFPVEVAVMPTVRESDGLAMSSRNAYLDEGQRARAAALSRALAAARARAEAGGAGADDLLATARRVLDEAGIEPEYLEIRDAETLAPTPGMNGRPMLIAIAARVGDARLIDNVVIEPKE